MSKTIIELCRELPASEAEIRERRHEFNKAVFMATADLTQSTDASWDYLSNIADAKAATDAMVYKGWRLTVESRHDGDLHWYKCVFWKKEEDALIVSEVSTEELARSAAALLAADAMAKERALQPPS